MAFNSVDVAKAFAEEIDAINREIQRTSDIRYRDWLLGLRERMTLAARGV